jgi:hypothetical protein
MAEIGRPNSSKLKLGDRRDLHRYSRIQFNLELNPHLSRRGNELELSRGNAWPYGASGIGTWSGHSLTPHLVHD